MNPDAYRAHDTWASLARLESAYQSVPTPPTEDHQTKLQAVGEAIAFVNRYRPDEYGETLLVNDNAMSNAYTHVTNVLQQVQNLDTDAPNWSYLDNAHVQATQNLVPWFQAQFPAPALASVSTAAKRAFTTEVNRLKTEVEALREQLKDEESAHDTQRQSLEQKLAELAAAAQEADTKVASLATSLNAQIDEQRTAFEAEAAQRATLTKEQLGVVVEQAKTDRVALEERANDLLKVLERHKVTSEALVDTTSRNAIAGDYGAWAQKQGKSALWWTAATVGVGLAAVAVLIYVLNHDSGDTTKFAIYKTGITVVMLIVAGYCASQAAEHRREERTAKRLHLDLAALEPFLKQVKDPEELRTQIALRVFAPQAEAAASGGSRFSFGRSLSYDQLLNLVTLLRKVE